MRTLLHVSDLHFGPKFVPERGAALRELAAAEPPDLLVVSGDLTQRARPEQFREARAFLDDLPVPALAVPGNHDVPLYRVWERALSPYGAYRRHFHSETEPAFTDGELLVVGINTAYGWTVTDGRVTPRRGRAVAELLRAADPGLFKVVVVHHHLAPPPAYAPQRELLEAAASVTAFVEAGADLMLAGHAHQAFIADSRAVYSTPGRVPLVHSGTTTSSRGRGGERGGGSLNRIRVDAGAVTVEPLLWDATAGRFVAAGTHTYPRRRPAVAAAPRGREEESDG